MPIFPLFRWLRRPKASDVEFVEKYRAEQSSTQESILSRQAPQKDSANNPANVKRHFYNEKGFQCFASFFPLWNGWATAGHVLTDAAHAWPDFAGLGADHIWPEGLDAALKGCDIPDHKPAAPKAGQIVDIWGYPAGSRYLEKRSGTVYIERGAGSGTWIAHIKSPDEPVVSGMSGGPVIDRATGAPLGIVITRNSPADLNADRDPDESCDFVALSSVWEAIAKTTRMS